MVNLSIFRDKKLEEKFEDGLFARNVANANGNLDERTFNGRRLTASNTIFKEVALERLVSRTTARNHRRNRVYIHDLDSYASGMHNCLSIPIDRLLEEGFVVRQQVIRPPKSLRSACQLLAVVMQCQSQCQFGGVSYTHIDYTLEPFVRMSFYKHYKIALRYFEGLGADDVKWINPRLSITSEKYKVRRLAYRYAMEQTEEEAKQSIEALFHNLNSLQSRAGEQVPFSSINYGLCTSEEGRIIIKAILEATIKGGGNGQTYIFPCQIFQLRKGVNRKLGDPNYDLFRLALKSTAKRIYPNYYNCDWTNEADSPKGLLESPSTMGCRTYNGYDINGLGWQKDGRGNLAPVTIILPTIAMESKLEAERGHKILGEVFYRKLLDAIEEAKDSLIDRYDYMCSQSPLSAPFMYDNKLMAGYDGISVESALKHGTLVIGQVGLAECLQLLIGCDHTEERGMALAKDIEQIFKDKCAEYKEKYHLNFGVYYSPCESTVYTALVKFREKYGVIPNVSDRDYFTNSMHVPVWHNLNPFEKIDIESQLTGYHSAGCITYVELDASASNNIDGLETIVNYAMDKDIPYFAINVPVDTCDVCGYTGEINDVCPICGGKDITHLRRICGYLSKDMRYLNHGKQCEIHDRVKHFSWKNTSDLLEVKKEGGCF